MNPIRQRLRVAKRVLYPKLSKSIRLLAFPTFLGSVLLVGFFLSPYLSIDDELLRLMVSSTAIVVGLIVGFLFNSYFQVKRMRFDRLARFARLQDRLRMYQEAFGALAYQLLDKYRARIDFRLNKPLHELKRDTDFVESEDYFPVLWVHAIWDAASSPYHTPDFEKTSSILTEGRLNDICDAVEQACGLLTRRKYYGHILKAFGLEETDDLSRILIVHDDAFGIRYLAERLVKDRNHSDFRSLEFWEARLDDCLDLLERMKEHGMLHLLICSDRDSQIELLPSGCLDIRNIVPLFILTFGSFFSPFRIILSGISFIGFVSFFSLSLVVIYRVLTSGRLSF